MKQRSYTSRQVTNQSKIRFCLQKEGDRLEYHFFGGRQSPWTVRGIKGRYDSECGCQRRRKYHSQRVYPNAFEGVTDFSTRTKQLFEVPREVLPCETQRKNMPDATKKRGMNRGCIIAGKEQACIYFALFKVSGAKTRQSYIEESKTNSRKKTAKSKLVTGCRGLRDGLWGRSPCLKPRPFAKSTCGRVSVRPARALILKVKVLSAPVSGKHASQQRQGCPP